MKIAIEIDLKKIGILAGLAVSTLLAIKIGCADSLFLAIPAGIACLISKE